MCADLNVVDSFLNVFESYVDSGFGLLKDDVGHLAGILIAIDILCSIAPCDDQALYNAVRRGHPPQLQPKSHFCFMSPAHGWSRELLLIVFHQNINQRSALLDSTAIFKQTAGFRASVAGNLRTAAREAQGVPGVQVSKSGCGNSLKRAKSSDNLMSDTEELQSILVTISTAIDRIALYIAPFNAPQGLARDQQAQDAIQHAMYILGRASAKLYRGHRQFTLENDHIAWNDLRALGRKIGRSGFSTDPQSVWRIARNNMLPFRLSIHKLINAAPAHAPAEDIRHESPAPEDREGKGRAGEPWSDVEDRALYDETVEGVDLPELAAKHQRTPGAIHSRQKRLGLRDEGGRRVEPAPPFKSVHGKGVRSKKRPVPSA